MAQQLLCALDCALLLLVLMGEVCVFFGVDMMNLKRITFLVKHVV